MIVFASGVTIFDTLLGISVILDVIPFLPDKISVKSDFVLSIFDLFLFSNSVEDFSYSSKLDLTEVNIVCDDLLALFNDSEADPIIPDNDFSEVLIFDSTLDTSDNTELLDSPTTLFRLALVSVIEPDIVLLELSITLLTFSTLLVTDSADDETDSFTVLAAVSDAVLDSALAVLISELT